MVGMRTFKMGHGPDMPGTAYGTWQIPKEDAGRLVADALDAGYRHIDCAHIYQNEPEIGVTLGSYPNRSDLFVVSKLWCNSHEPHLVRPAFESTLKSLQCNYLDLYLVHTPCRTGDSFDSKWFSKDWILETWREMEKLVESDSCKAIGVSNFTTKKLGWLLDEASVKPANNQVELHPYLPQNKLLNFCKENGILVSAYSPLGRQTIENNPIFNDPSKPSLITNPAITELASKKGITPAQVLLSWALNRGTPVLCKSSNKNRMKENLKSAEITLSDEEMDLINKIGIRCRYLDFKIFCADGHTVEEFWDGEIYN